MKNIQPPVPPPESSAVQSYAVTFREPDSAADSVGLLRIDNDHRWRLYRRAPQGEQLVFDLPASGAWARLEELKAAGSLWDATSTEQIIVNY